MKMNQLACYEILLDVARSLTRAMDLEAVLNEILNRSKDVMSCDACSIFLPDPNTGELIIHSAIGDKAPLLNATRIPRGKGIAGAVFSEKEIINIKDARNDPRHYAQVDEKTGFETHAMLSIPLLNGKECLGVLQIINPSDKPAFDAADEKIAEVFGTLIVSALLRIYAQNQAIEKARAHQELELAREIQHSFLPSEHQIFETCEVRMAYFPARVVGGDFCLVLPLGKTRTLLCLGDVTGKGIPAALTMSRVTAKIQALSKKLALSVALQCNLGAWVTQLNEEIKNDLTSGRFIGVTFMLTDCKSSTVQVCAAGQYGPACSSKKEWTIPPYVKQMPLGVIPDFNYEAETHPLRPGQQWILYSDGITEARNSKDHEYTEKKFIEELPIGLTALSTLKEAVKGWKRFVGRAQQHDDASLLLLDWRGASPTPLLYTTCKPADLARGRAFVEEWCCYAGFDDIVAGHLVLACDEAVTNIFRYAYKGTPGPVKYTVEIESGELIIRIQDDGIPADMKKVKCRRLEDLRPGGLGTFVINKVFDSVEYEPREKGTMLKLKKKLPHPKKMKTR